MNNLILTPNKDNTFTVLEAFIVGDYEVPVGFKTNGADIPRIFWSYIAPNTPKYLPAIVIHDYLVDLGMYEEADEVFKEVLLEIEDSFKTKLMVKSVKFYTRWVR